MTRLIFGDIFKEKRKKTGEDEEDHSKYSLPARITPPPSTSVSLSLRLLARGSLGTSGITHETRDGVYKR